MKILFYSTVNLHAGGGCERWHCDVVNSLKSQFGHDIKIITTNLGIPHWSDDVLKTNLGEIEYQVIPQPIVSGLAITTPKAFFRLYQEFKKADAVHFIYGFAGQDIMVAILKVLTRKKVVVGHHAPTFHTSKFHNLYMKYISRRLMPIFDFHMTLNKKDKDYFMKQWGINNVHFIPSGVKVNTYLKIKKIKHSNLVFMTVGRLELQKGIDLLMEAITKLNNTIPNNKCEFHIIGSGSLESVVTKSAKVNKNIHNHGFISDAHLVQLYAKSDVYLSSSREEPFGLVLIEAWSSGLPVLATRTEGPLDMIESGKNGWFIEEITADGIFQAIKKLYSVWQKSSRIASKLERSCRQTGLKYSIDNTAKNMHTLFFSH
jgi:glycosyltransferase involved in cell wall biosynthesis